MSPFEYLATGIGNLRRAKLRTFLTVSAVVVGTFTLAMTTAFSQGLRFIVDQQLGAYSQPGNLFITHKPADTKTPPGTVAEYNPNSTNRGGDNFGDGVLLTADDLKTVQGIKGVTSAYGVIRTPQPDYIAYGDKKYQVLGFQGIYPSTVQQLAAGSPLDAEDQAAIVLPYDYVRTFNLSASELIGKQVTLHTTSQVQLDQGKESVLTVVGVLPDTVHVIGAYVSYQLSDALSEFQYGPSKGYSSIFGNQSPTASATEKSDLRAALDAKGYSLFSYEDVVDNFRKPLQIVTYSLDGFALVALLAGTLGIVNTLLMAVLERVQEIGLLKALGMRRRGIFALFLAEAAGIGLLGGLIGVGVAILAGAILNPILHTKLFQGVGNDKLLTYPASYMIAIIAGAVLIGILSGVLPSWRAARLDPIEALRRE